MAELVLTVTPAGTIRMLYDERLDLRALGTPSIRRASHVEPNESGEWTADMGPSGGPVLGPFRFRSEALEEEAVWLKTNRL